MTTTIFTTHPITLNGVDYEMYNPPADGNCLPVSLSVAFAALCSWNHTHAELRQKAAHYISDNWHLDDRIENGIINFFEEQKDWKRIDTDILVQDDVDLYVNRVVLKPYSYLGSIEIISLSQIFNCKVVVISKDLSSNLPPFSIIIGDALSSPCKTFSLYHTHGGQNEHANHYQALFDMLGVESIGNTSQLRTSHITTPISPKQSGLSTPMIAGSAWNTPLVMIKDTPTHTPSHSPHTLAGSAWNTPLVIKDTPTHTPIIPYTPSICSKPTPDVNTSHAKAKAQFLAAQKRLAMAEKRKKISPEQNETHDKKKRRAEQAQSCRAALTPDVIAANNLKRAEKDQARRAALTPDVIAANTLKKAEKDQARRAALTPEVIAANNLKRAEKEKARRAALTPDAIAASTLKKAEKDQARRAALTPDVIAANTLKKAVKDQARGAVLTPNVTASEKLQNAGQDQSHRSCPIIVAGELGTDASPDELLAIDRLRAIPDELKLLISKRLTQSFKDLAEITCCVCDLLKKKKSCRVFTDVTISSKLVMAMKTHLVAPDKLPNGLLSDYDQRHILPFAKGLMLGSDGCREHINKCGQYSMVICNKCFSALNIRNTIPKFAIAQGLFVGRLPAEFNGYSKADRLCVSLVHIVGTINVVTGGFQKRLQSHIMGLSSHVPGPIATMLPRPAQDLHDVCQIIFATHLTKPQKIAALKVYKLTISFVDRILEFLVKNNHLYENITVTPTADTSLSSFEPHTTDLHAAGMDIQFETSKRQKSHYTKDDVQSHSVPNVYDGASSHNDEVTLTEHYSALVSVLGQSEEAIMSSDRQKTYVARPESNFYSDRKGDIWGMAFPTLFPYGRGTPDEKRHKKISLEMCLKHYIRLSSRVFAQCADFNLYAFDMLSRSRASKQCYVQAFYNMSEDSADQIATLSLKDLTTFFDYEDKAIKARRKGLSQPERPLDMSSAAQTLSRNISSAESMMFNTNASRAKEANLAWGLWNNLGPAHGFFTISPNDRGSMVLCFYNGSVKDPSFAQPGFPPDIEIPLYQARVHDIANDPIAVARWFKRIVKIVFDVAFGFNSKTKLPYKHGGLAGHVKAYAGQTEEQNRLALHMHALLWLYGGPLHYREFIQRIKTDTVFRNDFIGYVNSVISSYMPVPFDSGMAFKCPSCNENTTFSSVNLPKSAHRRSSRFAKIPCNLVCDLCNEPTSTNVVMSTLMKDDGIDTSEGKGKLLSECAPPPLVDSLSPAFKNQQKRLSYVKFFCNQHREYHSDTCFKCSRYVKVCRMDMPKKLSKDTNFYSSDGSNLSVEQVMHSLESDEDFELLLVLKRPVGNEWINQTNDVILHHTACNSDYKIILGPGVVYYAMGYSFKPQQDIENEMAMKAAGLARKLMRDRQVSSGVDHTVSKSSKHIALGLAMAGAYHGTSRHETGAPLAGLFLLRGSSFFCSHSDLCDHIFLPHYISHLKGDPVLGSLTKHILSEEESSTESDNFLFVITSQLADYVLRPTSLLGYNAWEFLATHKKILAKNAPKKTDVLPFHPDHPQSATHCMVLRPMRVIVLIVGSRLPDTSIMHDNPGRLEYYHLASVALFSAFPSSGSRSPINGDETPAGGYLRLSQHFSLYDQFVLGNMQEFYDSKREAHSQTEHRQNQQDNDHDLNGSAGGSPCARSSGSSDNIDVDALNAAIDEDAGFTSDQTISVSTVCPATLYLSDFANTVMSNDMHTHLANTTKIGHTYLSTVTSTAGRRIDLSAGVVCDIDAIPPSNASVSKSIETAILQRDKTGLFCELLPGDGLNKPTYAPRLVTVTLLDDAMDDTVPPGSVRIEPDNLPFGASIGSISQAYTLNREQHAAFTFHGRNLLRKIRRSQTSSSSVPDMVADNTVTLKPSLLLSDQTLSMLHGSAGTGKSYVIAALRKLASVFNRPNAVLVLAPSGIAAVNANGVTIHTGCGLSFGSDRVKKRKQNIEVGRSRFSQCFLIIIDEISMVSNKLLENTSAAAQLHTGVMATLGGIDALFVGDFLQLQPVANSNPVFVAPLVTTRQCAFNLWSSISHEINLVENMRQKDDEAFFSVLQDTRFGKFSQVNIDLLNTRLLPGAEISPKGIGLMVVALNTHRQLVNAIAIAKTQQDSRCSVFRVFAKVSHKKKDIRSGSSLYRELMSLSSDRTKNLSIALDILVGMPIMITQNMCVDLGIANGTTGYIFAIQYPPGTIFEEGFDSVTGLKFLTPTISVFPTVWVAVDGAKFPRLSVSLDGMPDNVFPITANSTSAMGTGRQIRLYNRSISLNIKQLALVPMYAATCHKLQSKTLASMIMCDSKSHLDRAYFYVALSRCKTLHGIHFMGLLTLKDLKYFTPKPEVLAYIELLALRSEQIVDDFYKSRS